MIQLRSDCLVFETSNGEVIPCSAETVTVELIGDAAALLDPEVIRNAAAAVLHYFKVEQERTSVSVGEFSQALAHVLRGFGLEVCSDIETGQLEASVSILNEVADADLRRVACESGKAFELAFFPHLRDVMREKLNGSPRVLHFYGLRGCVKQIVGARRWTGRCQDLSDQIVEYLRQCLSAEAHEAKCGLVVK